MKRIIIISIIFVTVITTGVFIYFNMSLKMGAPYKTNSIIFRSLINENVALTLNLDCYVGGGIPPMANQGFTVTKKEVPNLFRNYNQYVNTLGVVALYEVLTKSQTDERIINIELISNRYILITTDIRDLKYAVIFRSSIFDGGNSWRDVSFDYMPLQGQFFNQDLFTDISNNYWQIEGLNIATYVPYHLFNDHSFFYQYAFEYYGGLCKNNNLSHQEGYNYKIDGNIADFKAFYKSLDLYEIFEEDSRLVLNGTFHKRDGSINHKEGRPSTEIVFPVNGVMTLDFKKEDGQRYVAYSFKTE